MRPIPPPRVHRLLLSLLLLLASAWLSPAWTLTLSPDTTKQDGELHSREEQRESLEASAETGPSAESLDAEALYEAFPQEAFLAGPLALPEEAAEIVLTDPKDIDPQNQLSLPDPYYQLEKIEIVGLTTLSKQYILNLLELQNGQEIRLSELEAARLRLLASRQIERVIFELEPGSDSLQLALHIHIKERFHFTIHKVYAGLSPKAQFWWGADVSHLNLWGKGHVLRSAFVATPNDEYSIKLDYGISKFILPYLSLKFSLYSLHLQESLYELSSESPNPESPLSTAFLWRHGGSIQLGVRPISKLSASLHLEYQYLFRRREPTTKLFEPYLKLGGSHLFALGLSLQYDDRNRDIFPSQGQVANIQLAGSLDKILSDYSYFRAAINYQIHFEPKTEHVLRLSSQLGLIFGNPPLFKKFHFADYYELRPTRIHGLNPSSAKAFDLFRTGSSHWAYEDFIFKLKFEYAWQQRFKALNYQPLELFINTALLYANSFSDNLYAFAPNAQKRSQFPIDTSFNFGLRFHSDLGRFELSLATLMHFIPR